MTVEWITSDEASEISGYSVQYLLRLIRQGKIKAIKKGGAWWIDRQALVDFRNATAKSPDKRHGPKST